MFKKRNLILILTIICMFFVHEKTVEASKVYRMISMPDVSNTSQRFDTLSADFRIVKAAEQTEWDLWYWGFDIADFKEKNNYYEVKRGSVHNAVQLSNAGKKVFMDIFDNKYWETENSELKYLNNINIYPGNAEETIEGEDSIGLRTNVDYDWEINNWYRMVAHIWKDKKTNHVFAGQWIENISTGEWTLISYFETNFSDTSIVLKDIMVQRQWNRYDPTTNDENEIHIKNNYAKEYSTQDWKSLSKSLLSYREYPDGNVDNVGKHEFGVKDGYFYLINGGIVDDYDEYNQSHPQEGMFEINQPSSPSFGDIDISKFKLSNNILSWNYSKTSTPQETVIITIEDLVNKTNKDIEINRPEVVNYELGEDLPQTYRITLKIRDIFGNEETKVITNYDEENDDNITVDNTKNEAKNQTVKVDNTSKDKNIMLVFLALLLLTTGVYVCIKYKRLKRTI